MDHAHSRRPGPGSQHPPPVHLAPVPRPRPGLPPAARLTQAEAWALVAPHRARLIAAARERGLSLPDAQDAAHHVMCRAVERGVLDPARAEATLVKAVAARCTEVVADNARREQALVRTRGDDRLEGAMEEAVCDRAQARWLLGKLPARERDVVVLSVAGETVTGIAAATGLSYPTVDRLLSRARKELRRLAGALGVVGLAAWRQRRLAAAPAATAVALAGVSFLVHTPAQPGAAVPDRGEVVADVARHGAPAPVRAAVRTAPPAAPRTARAALVPAARRAPATPPRTEVARVGDVTVDRGDETYAERLEKCLKNGVSVEVGAKGSAVVCEEELMVEVVRP